jgi:hypothetical protein
VVRRNGAGQGRVGDRIQAFDIDKGRSAVSRAAAGMIAGEFFNARRILQAIKKGACH